LRREYTYIFILDPGPRIRETVGDNNEFISLIMDQNKNIVESKRMIIDWGTNDKEKVYQYSTVGLAPGRYDCQVVIRNLDNGKGALLRQWTVFENVITLMTPDGFANLMSTMWAERCGLSANSA